MPVIELSVMEAELFSVVMCAREILFVMRILNSMGFQLKLLMKIEMENKGAKDTTNNWSVR